MNSKIYILGAGGHTRSLINLLEYNNYEISGIYDDHFTDSKEEIINKYCVIGKLNDLSKDYCVVLSFGDNNKRRDLFVNLTNQILKENLIHPTAKIENYFVPGDSNQIFANTFINSNVSLGSNNIINTGSILEHEVKVGNHNHISVGSIICGRVSIGSRCFIGAGATIIDKLSITDDVVIGANSVVICSIEEPGIYVGCPARRVK